MADFKSALKDGFAAAEKADHARREIVQVLTQLMNDVLESSEGKILIELARLRRPPPAEEYSMSGITSVTVAAMFRPRPMYTALVAKNPIANSEAKKLAEWSQSRNGYPVALTWNSQERQCEDRVALESCLADLLKDPVVGETLFSLTQLKAE